MSIKLKNLLAENMRRFKTKNLSEQETQDPIKSSMSKFATDMQKASEDQNVDDRVGRENYEALSKIATDNGMTLSNETTDGTYWKWTKELRYGNQLVFIILNPERTKYTGYVTSYVDRDGGKYLEAKSGKLQETGDGSMGTYPFLEELPKSSLMFNGRDIAAQPDQLTKLQTNLTTQQNRFK